MIKKWPGTRPFFYLIVWENNLITKEWNRSGLKSFSCMWNAGSGTLAIEKLWFLLYAWPLPLFFGCWTVWRNIIRAGSVFQSIMLIFQRISKYPDYCPGISIYWLMLTVIPFSATSSDCLLHPFKSMWVNLLTMFGNYILRTSTPFQQKIIWRR